MNNPENCARQSYKDFKTNLNEKTLTLRNNTLRSATPPKARKVSKLEALNLLSELDHEIVHFLSEHRVITTQQMQMLLDSNERTVRYRLERLNKLGIAEDLRSFYLERQRQKISEIFERYAHLPVAERSMPRLEAAELLSWIDEARLEETVRRDVAKLKEERSGLAAYVTWRAREVKNRKGGLGMVGRLIGNSDQLATQIDEELLQYCQACRHIALPHSQFGLYATRSICNFCDNGDLESLKEARRAGDVESDGNGFWQVCYPPSPTWAESPEL